MSTVKALVDCYVGTKAGPKLIALGEEFDENDPLVKGNKALFTEPEPDEPKRPSFTSGKGPKG